MAEGKQWARNFKRLDVWQLAMDVAIDAYEMTSRLPDSEKFGLCSQIRRCALSIPANIAEGAGRVAEKDFSRFLNIAQGSLNELETLTILCHRLGFLDEESADGWQVRLRNLTVMIRNLRTRLSPDGCED